MIDYTKVKVGDELRVTGKGAPGFALRGTTVRVVNVYHNGVTVENSYGEADFKDACGAERLEAMPERASAE